jgi:iron complex transport system substrate-binding protein
MIHIYIQCFIDRKAGDETGRPLPKLFYLFFVMQSQRLGKAAEGVFRETFVPIGRMEAKMRKKPKKSVILALVVAFGLAALSGCGGGKTADSDGGTTEAAPPEPRILTDHAGNEVTVPDEINRIVVMNILPLASVYALFDGSAEKLVGIHPSAYAAAENSFLPKVAPDILSVSTDFVKGEDINIEELLKLAPDVVFYQAEDKEQYQKLTDAGLIAIGFSTTKWDFNTVETFAGWVELLGKILNEEDKAAGIVEYGRAAEKEITDRLAAAGTYEKPNALILFHYDGTDLKPSGSKFFGRYWLETTGATNAAAELEGWPQVDIEQIYAWDPDIIYLTNFSPYQPEDLINNTIEGYDWRNVRAVREGRVYKFPLGMYRWFPPSSDVPLALWWLAKTNQPEIFADVDLNAKVKEYYKQFYDVELTDADVEQIFNPSSAAAATPTK